MITVPTMSRYLRLSFALVSLLIVNSLADAQDTAGKPVATVAVDVRVVTLPVTVRDKKGQIVRNLTKDDFVLQEDGRPQVIKYFDQDTNLPLTLGLLVDTSMSQRNVLDQEKNASKVFLDQMLTDAKDKAFLIHFDREVELLQDLTSSRDQLQKGLELLNTPQLERNSGGSSDPQSSDPQSSPGSGNGQPRMSRGGGTLLYDAIFLASDELMKKQQGRKALVVLSDGVDRGSKESLQSTIEAAQRADTVVYSILFADKSQENNGFGHQGGGMGRHGGWPGGGFPGGGGSGRGGGRSQQEPHPDGKKILDQISKETGGRLYEVSKKLAIDQIYDSIAEELRAQYNLGYTPDKGNAEAAYHKISLVTKQKELVVQTRDGYYAER
ncbi:MAG TPA: VWA domain-containing protein [Terriglobales bacterium]|nr:VWA domain-containing protein [Terriglobales bacterium]